MISLKLNNVSKRYTRKNIFKDISSVVKKGEILVLKGYNGSGKSTLLKVIAQFLPASNGSIEYLHNNEIIPKEKCLKSIGFNAPYFNLFNDLTAIENIKILLKSRDAFLSDKEIKAKLTEFQLSKKGHVPIQNYSSGMQQRIKLLCATLFEPMFLFLDEPTSNLDVEGKELVKRCIENQKKHGITIICTNEEEELNWGDVFIDLN